MQDLENRLQEIKKNFIKLITELTENNGIEEFREEFENIFLKYNEILTQPYKIRKKIESKLSIEEGRKEHIHNLLGLQDLRDQIDTYFLSPFSIEKKARWVKQFYDLYKDCKNYEEFYKSIKEEIKNKRGIERIKAYLRTNKVLKQEKNRINSKIKKLSEEVSKYHKKLKEIENSLYLFENKNLVSQMLTLTDLLEIIKSF